MCWLTHGRILPRQYGRRLRSSRWTHALFEAKVPRHTPDACRLQLPNATCSGMNGSSRVLLIAMAAFLLGGGTALAEGPSGGTPERAPHPEPRVIVNVLSVRGPHNPAQIQRSARFGWIRIVRCYKSKGARERAVVKLGLVISSEGDVASAWSANTHPQYPELTSCIAGALQGLAMPKASANSTAEIEIQLAPGDRPLTHALAHCSIVEPVEPVVAHVCRSGAI